MPIPIAQGLCDLLDPAKYAWGIREREKEEKGKGKGETLLSFPLLNSHVSLAL
jgi:hypothetical protein